MTDLLITWILFSFVIWRITRYWLKDSMLEEFRFKVEAALGRKIDRFWHRKALELLSCPWCISVWVSAGLTTIWRVFEADGLSWFWTGVIWLASAAGAMACWRTWEEE